MSSNQKLPKIQHYVPQFILRGFRAHKKGRVWAFDLTKSRSFCTSIRNVAAEAGFYNFVDETGPQSAEPFLANIEGDNSRIIKQIRNTESLAFLTRDERVKLSLFTAVQIVRVKKMRERFAEIKQHVHDKLVSIGCDPSKCHEISGFDDEEQKRTSVQYLGAVPELAEHIFDKGWILYRAPKRFPVDISDNPITLHNTALGEQSSLGLAVDGIEVNFPISSRLSICFLCRKFAAAILQRVSDSLFMWQHGIPIHTEELRVIANALKNGTPIDLNRENVQHLNSLQVNSASRFIFSSVEEFQIAKEMLRRNPDLPNTPSFKLM